MDRAAMLTLDKANAKPLHIQIEESILQKLESREWAPGRLIPSENELSHIYGVSRTTVRNVITKLVQEGLLFRIPGKGTYVAEPKIVAHSLTYAGIREQLEQMGYEVSTRLISMGLETVDQKIMEHFPGSGRPPLLCGAPSAHAEGRAPEHSHLLPPPRLLPRHRPVRPQQ